VPLHSTLGSMGRHQVLLRSPAGTCSHELAYQLVRVRAFSLTDTTWKPHLLLNSQKCCLLNN
jgi:hypothetical protein